jgi:tRNA A37 methylthiotransferase MiaB
MTKEEISKKVAENHKLIQEQLKAGFAVVDNEEEAKVYILNVCKLLAENISLIFERDKLNKH